MKLIPIVKSIFNNTSNCKKNKPIKSIVLFLSALCINNSFAQINMNLPKINTTNFKNIKIYHVQTKSIPSISISWLFKKLYPADNACISDIAFAMIGKQISNYSEEETNNALSDMGAEFSVSNNKDFIQLNLRTLNSDRDNAIKWLGQAIYTSVFTQDIFNREKARVLQNVQDQEKDPAYIANQNLILATHNNHLYSQFCTSNLAKNVSLMQVRSYYYQQFIALDSPKIILTGYIAVNEINNLLEKNILDKYTNNNTNIHEKSSNENTNNLIKLETPNQYVFNKEIKVINNTYDMDITQSQIRMGMPFIQRDNPDIFNIMAGNYILGGGGFNSRLMEALREKQGFVYGISSNFMPWENSGLFIIELQTKINQTQPAIKLVKTTVDDFLVKGINKQELDKAKKFLLQSFSSRLDTNEKWLSQLSIIAYYNLPLNYLDTWQQNLNNTTVESVNNAMRKYLDVNRLNISIVTKQ